MISIYKYGEVENDKIFARAQSDGFEGTDDNSLVEHLGYRVRMVECGAENLKITTPDDLAMAEAIMLYRSRNL